MPTNSHPAFVVHFTEDGKSYVHPGLTKREYAAIHVAAACATHGMSAKVIVEFVDALLKELEG
jgi:hypothetical protein